MKEILEQSIKGHRCSPPPSCSMSGFRRGALAMVSVPNYDVNIYEDDRPDRRVVGPRCSNTPANRCVNQAISGPISARLDFQDRHRRRRRWPKASITPETRRSTRLACSKSIIRALAGHHLPVRRYGAGHVYNVRTRALAESSECVSSIYVAGGSPVPQSRRIRRRASSAEQEQIAAMTLAEQARSWRGMSSSTAHGQ